MVKVMSDACRTSTERGRASGVSVTLWGSGSPARRWWVEARTRVKASALCFAVLVVVRVGMAGGGWREAGAGRAASGQWR